MTIWILRRIEWGGSRLAGVFTSRNLAETALRERGYTLDGKYWVQPPVRVGIASAASEDVIALGEITADAWLVTDEDDILLGIADEAKPA